MKKSRWLYEFRFLDHCSTINGLSEPVECITYGIIATEDKKAYYVANWIAGGELDENANINTILKGAVTKKKRLCRVYF